MSTLLRAVFAFAIAFAIAAPHRFAATFDTPRMAAVKAELAAAHPGAKLQLMIEDGLKRLPAVGKQLRNGSPGQAGGHQLF